MSERIPKGTNRVPTSTKRLNAETSGCITVRTSTKNDITSKLKRQNV